MAFLTIHPAPGLDADARQRAIEAGPPAVAVRTSHESLLRSARFVEIESVDLTDQYRVTQQAWIDGWAEHEAELRVLVGDQDFDERMDRRRGALAAIDDGILKRTLYTASAPGR